MAGFIDSFKGSLQTLIGLRKRVSGVSPELKSIPTVSPVDPLELLSSGSTLPQVQQQSNAAEAEESSMSTTAVVTQQAAATVHESWIHRLGSLFNHGAKGAIALIEKDAKPIESIALVAGTLAGVGPEVQATEDTFNAMFSEVVQVQQIATAVGAGAGTGVQKLAAAIPQVEQVILADPLFKGKTITDLAKWNAAVASIAGALYDLGNSVAVPAQETASAAKTS